MRYLIALIFTIACSSGICPASGQAGRPFTELSAASDNFSMADTAFSPTPAAADTAAEPAVKRMPKKSLKKAFFMSLVIPGAGEYYAGAKTQAKGFWGAEAVIWSFALVSKFQGEMWKRDYRNYAAQYAGANPQRTEDIYYQSIYEYSSSYWYNQDIWAEARMIYPDDPQAQETYVAGLLYESPDDWAWQTSGQWSQYRSLRVKSQEALHRISYSYGAALLNRVLSAVNAARLAKRYNKRRISRASLDENWQIRFLTLQTSDFGVALRKTF